MASTFRNGALASLAKRRAISVLPTPVGPEKIKLAGDVFEEKDYMWVPILERDIRNRGGTGMIVAGAYHLVEDSGFSGLTSKLLADKGLPVNIIYHNKYQG